MTTGPAPQVLRWVQEGERLFGEVLQTLQRYQEIETKAETLAKENQRLLEEMQAMREELRQLRAERIEAAETLKAFAEHVTQLATLAIQRLGRRGG
jgi:predicted nuclease with TOPRIM domain